MSSCGGFLDGALGFAMFCFLVAVLVVPLGAPAAFAIGLLGAVLVQLVAHLTVRPALATVNALESRAGSRWAVTGRTDAPSRYVLVAEAN